MADKDQIWRSLRDEEYRREFAADVGTGLAFQIRLLREKKGWTQEHLAQLTGKKQETISAWESPTYENYTLNSLRSLAGAFDVGLMVKFVPFSELVDWTVNLTPERLAPPSFRDEEDAYIRNLMSLGQMSTSDTETVAMTREEVINQRRKLTAATANEDEIYLGLSC